MTRIIIECEECARVNEKQEVPEATPAQSWATPRMNTLSRLLLLGAARSQFSVPNDKPSAQGVTTDVKYIKCAACEAVVTEAYEAFAAQKKALKTIKPSEALAQQLVDNICEPDDESGAWLRSVDLIEQEAEGGGRRLALVKQEDEGPCEVECATVKLACEAAVSGFENELVEALFSGEADAAGLRASACKDWSNACKKPPPKLDPSRPDGPAFRPLTDEERGWRERGGPPPPGVMATDDELRVRFGLAGGDNGSPPPLAQSAAFVEI